MTADGIDIWYGDAVDEAQHYQRYWKILDAVERANSAKFINPLLQKRYVLIHGRLRILLAEYAQRAPENLVIRRSEYGKPFLAEHPALAFNLSHTGGSFVIAVALDCRLGVDLEFCKPRADLPGLVERIFTEEEAGYWQQLPEGRKMQEFYRFWTRKEAFVKAVGRGLALGLKQCAINITNPSEFVRIPAEFGPASLWRVNDVDLGPDFCCAFVADKNFSVVRLRNFSD